MCFFEQKVGGKERKVHMAGNWRPYIENVLLRCIRCIHLEGNFRLSYLTDAFVYVGEGQEGTSTRPENISPLVLLGQVFPALLRKSSGEAALSSW